ncbi:Do family serine endopeptidase [Cognatilysobacter bugurensis]|uniref:Probable periplasmic serine endoprotease DegP-like n=1 Tax=Cognatilysobacter bugurensis TaxID=543356 RepID=A0A918W6H8_9GAMM|nr:Do family serine endopeptidase [Lysobacter bugurensis]GHA69961.1 peptidase S1 [Lysobacter bugurensis]
MNRPLRAFALVGAIAIALPTACTAQSPDNRPAALPPVPSTAPPAVSMVSGLPDFTNLVQQVGPAVVSISAEVGSRSAMRGGPEGAPGQEEIPEIFRRFFGDEMPMPGPQQGPRPRGISQGTGFLISDDGYVLTNHHVVDGAETVSVRLADRREFQAKVIGSDEQSDVALLKVEGKGLPALRTSGKPLKAGEWVVAIGSPFGLDHSVTAGIVSAVGRANPYANQQYVPFIQTDVAINRGNSGGPLLNTKGEVVGINSQIFSNSGGYMGVSFAIPIDVAMNAVQQLRETGRVSRGLLGVGVQLVTAEEARVLGLEDVRGALVNAVQPGGAAAKAGIEVGDVIRAVNGKPVDVSSDLPPLVGLLPPGTRATITVIRDGRQRDIPVVLDALEPATAAAAPGNAPAPAGAPPAPAARNALGIAARDLAPAERQRLGVEAGQGAIITGVDGEGAREAGLQPGDVILRVGRTPVDGAAALAKALGGVEAGKTVMLLVRRGGATQWVTVTADGR